MNTTLAAINSAPCPGYVSPVTGIRYHRPGQTHSLTTRNGVRCASCGVDEPTLRAEAAKERPANLVVFDAPTLAEAEAVAEPVSR